MIEKEILQAIEPSALEVSLGVAEDIEQEKQRKINHWLQRLERASYKTERIYRQYNAIEPENRLVARTLEKQWEEALSAEARLKKDYKDYCAIQSGSLSELERNEIRNLAQDIPELWRANTTTQEERQSIVRLLITRVIVSIQNDTEKMHAQIHWEGGYKTQRHFTRPVGKLEQLSYYRELIERAAHLYHEGKSLDTIADILTREGWQSPKQRGLFSSNRVSDLLNRKSIKRTKKSQVDRVQRAKDELTFRELSEKTSIPEPTLFRWLKVGKLQARRDQSASRKGIWLIKADEQEIKRLTSLKSKPKQWIYNARVEKVD